MKHPVCIFVFPFRDPCQCRLYMMFFEPPQRMHKCGADCNDFYENIEMMLTCV